MQSVIGAVMRGELEESGEGARMNLPILEKATSPHRCCSAPGDVGMGKQARPLSRGVLSHEKSESAVRGKQSRWYVVPASCRTPLLHEPALSTRVLWHSGSEQSPGNDPSILLKLGDPEAKLHSEYCQQRCLGTSTYKWLKIPFRLKNKSRGTF